MAVWLLRESACCVLTSSLLGVEPGVAPSDPARARFFMLGSTKETIGSEVTEMCSSSSHHLHTRHLKCVSFTTIGTASLHKTPL